MKEIKNDNLTIKLKKDFLTRSESGAIIETCVENLKENPGNIEGLMYDYLGVEEYFINCLGLICIEDFTDDLKEQIYNNGLEDEVIYEITNAEKTLSNLWNVLDLMYSNENILNSNLKKLIDKLPDKIEMDEILDKLPQEWREVVGEFKNITGQDKDDK